MAISTLLISIGFTALLLIAIYYGITNSAEFKRIPVEQQPMKKNKLKNMFFLGYIAAQLVVIFQVFIPKN
jgi:hypothetical protein